MHGLINKAVQNFYRDTYGRQAWLGLVRDLQLPVAEFEPMLQYEPALTRRLITGIAEALDKPEEAVLEDLGTYLVSHPNVEALRRLLRFGGETFIEFLHSLDDVADRARLAVEDLELPELELWLHGGRNYSVICHCDGSGFGHVLVGALRALADDYGALVFLEHRGSDGGDETIDVTVFEAEFSKGRDFDLGAGAA